MERIRFDFNNMFSVNIGHDHGVSEAELESVSKAAERARSHLLALLRDEQTRIELGLEWAQLPFQGQGRLDEIERLAREVRQKYDNVLFLGIGGSYLGLKAAQDALCPAYFNDFPGPRKGRPRVYFEGNNLDPDTLGVLLKNLGPKKTFVVVISKSGETTETKAAFAVTEEWLKRGAGKSFGRQVVAITDPESGRLRRRVNAEQAKDSLSFRSLDLKKGVGGRYSELNMGLLHLAVMGVEIKELFRGAQDMARRCKAGALLENPALLYAALQTVLYKSKKKSIAIMMPFAESLKSTASWYVQLLAESLGKKYARKIKRGAGGREIWEQDAGHVLNTGRTPVAACGTNDLHSIQQNNIEGENNKAVTFIKVKDFKEELRVGASADFLSGKKFSLLIGLAEEASEWALVREQRPNCAIILPEVNPYYWGGLIFFLEMATAYEGELLNVNAFDQPGVEGYKNYIYYKLHKPGLPEAVAKEISQRPLLKNAKFIV